MGGSRAETLEDLLSNSVALVHGGGKSGRLLSSDESGLSQKTQAYLRWLEGTRATTTCYLVRCDQAREEGEQRRCNGRLGVPIEVAESKIHAAREAGRVWGMAHLSNGVVVSQQKLSLDEQAYRLPQNVIYFSHDFIWWVGPPPLEMAPDSSLGIRGIPGREFHKPSSYSPPKDPRALITEIQRLIEEGGWLYAVGATVVSPGIVTRMGWKELRTCEMLPVPQNVLDFNSMLAEMDQLTGLPGTSRRGIYSAPGGLDILGSFEHLVGESFNWREYNALAHGFSPRLAGFLGPFLGQAIPASKLGGSCYIESSDRGFTVCWIGH